MRRLLAAMAVVGAGIVQAAEVLSLPEPDLAPGDAETEIDQGVARTDSPPPVIKAIEGAGLRLPAPAEAAMRPGASAVKPPAADEGGKRAGDRQLADPDPTTSGPARPRVSPATR